MSTNRNVPLRGIADSTKRESAPPAIYNIQAHVDIYSPRNSAQRISPGGAAKHGLIDVVGFTALEFLRRAGGLPPCGYKFD
jgi:hypothetical protein